MLIGSEVDSLDAVGAGPPLGVLEDATWPTVTSAWTRGGVSCSTQMVWSRGAPSVDRGAGASTDCSKASGTPAQPNAPDLGILADSLIDSAVTANGGPLDDDLALLSGRAAVVSVSATRAGRSSRTGFRRLGLRQRLAVAFVAVGVVATVATTVLVWAYVRLSDARHDVVDQIDPARLQVQLLLEAYLNQETGVRGFVLTGDRTFLTPYTGGLSQAPVLGKRSVPCWCTAGPPRDYWLTWTSRPGPGRMSSPFPPSPTPRSFPLMPVECGQDLFNRLRASFANLDA